MASEGQGVLHGPAWPAEGLLPVDCGAVPAVPGAERSGLALGPVAALAAPGCAPPARA